MHYQTGFLNHFATQAVEGALPKGRNSPQRPAFGLYAEQFSTTAFTVPRVENRRSWLYRMRPTTAHGAFQPYEGAARLAAPDGSHTTPNRLRWDPLSMPEGAVDFVDGLITYGGNGDPSTSGIGIHLYAATASMDTRAFQNSDGEMLIVPQQGALHIVTELGRMDVSPGSIALIPACLLYTSDAADE